jgi:hypothetical protein
VSDLLIQHVPKNFRSDWGTTEVTGDLYNICNRMAELSPNLLMRDRAGYGWPEDGGKRYICSEICVDGIERWVWGFQELDARVIEKLEYMLHVPFEIRFAEAERLEAQIEEARKQAELDRLVETVGLPMLPDLERTGFIQRPVSYRKGNATAIRHRAEYAKRRGL